MTTPSVVVVTVMRLLSSRALRTSAALIAVLMFSAVALGRIEMEFTTARIPLGVVHRAIGGFPLVVPHHGPGQSNDVIMDGDLDRVGHVDGAVYGVAGFPGDVGVGDLTPDAVYHDLLGDGGHSMHSLCGLAREEPLRKGVHLAGQGNGSVVDSHTDVCAVDARGPLQFVVNGTADTASASAATMRCAAKLAPGAWSSTPASRDTAVANIGPTWSTSRYQSGQPIGLISCQVRPCPGSGGHVTVNPCRRVCAHGTCSAANR